MRKLNGHTKGFVSDVMPKLKTESFQNEGLKKRETLLSEAEKLASIGSFEWNILENKVTWSDGLYHIYGLQPQEFGASFEAFVERVHPSCRAMVKKTIQNAYERGEPFEMEEWIVRPDGEIRVLFSKGEVIKDASGQPLRLVGVCQDITERKRSREQEIRQKLLEADNARKTKELEDARRLQLSMLPKNIPTLPDAEIAVFMKPAAEVGGDYYDFAMGDDGTLTLAIGDATGHGLRSGTMVTATKSLFNAMAKALEPVPFLRETSRALKLMGFRNLYMALTLAKFKKGKLRLSSAGMPYALVYRKTETAVEEIVLKGMPLGRFPDYPYGQKEIRLFPGDTIVFMSDGLADRFNRDNERLGEDRIKNLLKDIGDREPKQIIQLLLQAGNDWGQSVPAHDDMTFVVLKMKS